MATNDRTMKLKSNEDDIFEVDGDIIKQLGILEGFESSRNDDVIPLNNIDSATLKKVIEWADYHKNDLPQIEDDETREKNTAEISVWDQNFMNVDSEMLFKLVLAANFLNMKGLLDLTCKAVANLIKGRSPEFIRRTFHLRTDYTPAEEEQIRKEEEWASED